MSTESKPRQIIEELVGFVRDRAAETRSRTFSPKPSSQQVERAILSAISSEARNVTEIVKAIGLASGGTWQPTSGQVQTTLTSLIEAGLVTSKTKGDRKTYIITKDGTQSLAASADEAATDSADAKSSSSKNMRNLSWLTCDPEFLKAASKLAPAMLDVAQTGTREQQSKAAAVLENARHELHVILAEK